jgi:hypothetical protein
MRTALASSFDLLQGTLEKIYFQSLLSQQALGRRQLDAEIPFLYVFRRRFAVVDGLQLIAPAIQGTPGNAQLFG